MKLFQINKLNKLGTDLKEIQSKINVYETLKKKVSSILKIENLTDLNEIINGIDKKRNEIVSDIQDNIVRFRPIELTKSVQYAFEREKDIVSGLSLDKLLNNQMPSGNVPGNVIPLPYHDIAFLIALGFSLKQVHGIITSSFDSVKIGYNSFQKQIYRIFGDKLLSAQKMLVSPVIESIIDEIPSKFPNIPSGIAITNVIRDIGRTKAPGWFANWLKGEYMLDIDFKRIWGNVDKKTGRGSLEAIKDKINLYYKRYYGAPWKQWESWLIKGLTAADIAKKLNIPKNMVIKIFSKVGSSNEIRKVARRRVFVELLALGISPKDIYTKTFGHSDARVYTRVNHKEMLDSIESLFDDAMTYNEIISHDWTSQVEGWIEFYGLVRGTDY